MYFRLAMQARSVTRVAGPKPRHILLDTVGTTKSSLTSRKSDKFCKLLTDDKARELALPALSDAYSVPPM